MKPLFGYGTFRKTAWRDAIFGAAYACEPATLTGWHRIAVASGYLSLRETVVPLAVVPGALIALDDIGWRIADAWEEVPKYVRVEVEVNTMRGPVAAVTYVSAQDEPTLPVDDDRFALLSDAEVEASIDTFAAKMRSIRRAFA
jgi:gamma-glutamylcyclotransferase (GGCT)/AIG2-like uncharacterized protein YtfP